MTHDLVDESSENILYDCLDSVIASNLCNIDTSTRRRACCSDIDLCNLHLMVEPFLPVTTKDPEVTTESATPQVVSTGRHVYVCVHACMHVCVHVCMCIHGVHMCCVYVCAESAPSSVIRQVCMHV